MDETKKLGCVAVLIVGGLVAGVGGLVAVLALARAPSNSSQPTGSATNRPAQDQPRRTPDPKPPVNVETWSHRELFEKLQSAGLTLDSVPYLNRGPTSVCLLEADNPRADEIRGWIRVDWPNVPGAIAQEGSGAVVVTKEESAQAAKDRAGIFRPEDGVFAWGPFYFAGDSRFVSKLREALR